MPDVGPVQTRLTRKTQRERPRWGRRESAFPPVEHPERAEGVPAARLPHATLEGEVDTTGMDPIEQPTAVRLPLRAHDLDGLRHPGIGLRARMPEVVERPEHVVAPGVREREVEVRRTYHLAGALAAEQASLEQVLLPAASRLAYRGGPAGRPLASE